MQVLDQEQKTLLLQGNREASLSMFSPYCLKPMVVGGKVPRWGPSDAVYTISLHDGWGSKVYETSFLKRIANHLSHLCLIERERSYLLYWTANGRVLCSGNRHSNLAPKSVHHSVFRS